MLIRSINMLIRSINMLIGSMNMLIRSFIYALLYSDVLNEDKKLFRQAFI